MRDTKNNIATNNGSAAASMTPADFFEDGEVLPYMLHPGPATLGFQKAKDRGTSESPVQARQEDPFLDTRSKSKVRPFPALVHTLMMLYSIKFSVHHITANALADEELWLITFIRKDKRRWRMRYLPITDGILGWLKVRAKDPRPTELTFELYRSLNEHGRLAFDDAQGFPTNYYERFEQPADGADIKQAQKQIDFLIVDLLQAGYRNL